MEIEDTTTYAYRLKYLENPSFNNILGLTKMFIDSFPQKLIDELNEGINQYNGILFR